MDISAIASGSTSFASAKVALEVNASMMKESMSLVEEEMMTLLAALSGSGQNIDMMA